MSLKNLFQVRILLVDALVQLCGRQEAPHQFKASRSSKRLRHVEELDEPCKRLKVDDLAMHEKDSFADVLLVNDIAKGTTAVLCCPFASEVMKKQARVRGNTNILAVTVRRDTFGSIILRKELSERALTVRTKDVPPYWVWKYTS